MTWPFILPITDAQAAFPQGEVHFVDADKDGLVDSGEPRDPEGKPITAADFFERYRKGIVEVFPSKASGDGYLTRPDGYGHCKVLVRDLLYQKALSLSVIKIRGDVNQTPTATDEDKAAIRGALRKRLVEERDVRSDNITFACHEPQFELSATSRELSRKAGEVEGFRSGLSAVDRERLPDIHAKYQPQVNKLQAELDAELPPQAAAPAPGTRLASSKP